jgi:V8-like Glu-specific endopeptidase
MVRSLLQGNRVIPRVFPESLRGAVQLGLQQCMADGNYAEIGFRCLAVGFHSRVWANVTMETRESRCVVPASFTRGSIFALVFVVASAFISEGVLATEEVGTDSHREIIDTHNYPWSSIGKVFIARGRWCTGAVIGPNQFLTAAHCLYGRSVDSIHITVGYEGGGYRLQRDALRYTIPPAYNPQLSTWVRSPLDWGIIYTDEPFPPDVRPLRLASALPLPGTAVKIGGYPAEGKYMMRADLHCRIGTATPDGKVFAHDCVVRHGDSGGPVLSGDDEGLILGVAITKDESKEGGWAVSTASITTSLQGLAPAPLSPPISPNIVKTERIKREQAPSIDWTFSSQPPR